MSTSYLGSKSISRSWRGPLVGSSHRRVVGWLAPHNRRRRFTQGSSQGSPAAKESQHQGKGKGKKATTRKAKSQAGERPRWEGSPGKAVWDKKVCHPNPLGQTLPRGSASCVAQIVAPRLARAFLVERPFLLARLFFVAQKLLVDNGCPPNRSGNDGHPADDSWATTVVGPTVIGPTIVGPTVVGQSVKRHRAARKKQRIPDGWVQIINRKAGLVTWIWGKQNGLNRIEPAGDYFKIRCQDSGEYLALKEWAARGEKAPRGHPAALHLVPDSGERSMLWKFEPLEDGYWRIVNRESGQCLEPVNPESKRLARQGPPHEGAVEQQWRIELVK